MGTAARSTIAAASAALFAAAMAGCAAIIGLDDLTRTGELDGSVEGGSPGEGGSPDVVGFGCASGYDCVNAPPGWQPVGFSPNGRSACAGDSAKEDIQAQSGAAAQCTCTCGGGNCTGNTDIYLGSGSCPGTPTTVASLNQTCRDITDAGGNPSVTFTSYRITGGTPAGACNASTTNIAAPTNGRVCSATTKCSAGLCAPRGNGYSACIRQSGDQACPAGFPNKFVVGDSIHDGRTCSGCVCGPPSCAVQVTMWSNPNCNGAADLTATGDGGCATTAQKTIRTFTSTLSSACSVVTQPTIQGTRTVSNQSTVCCP